MLLGPLIQVGRTVANEIQNQASERLREHFAQPIPEPPVRARSIDDDDDDHIYLSQHF
ncbi:hypothetical protein MPER_06420 [Moniliophthora perniciosa FA553]|nr:hypothetical protein MPER_06420 [Moniliophthora perniciosa FA553]